MLEPYLERIYQALDLDLRGAACERLGGLTNRNYRLDSNHGSFVLRIAGQGTSEYINRAQEEINARIASQAGVNVDILFFDAGDGTLLSRFLSESQTMSAAAFKDPGCLRRAGRVLRKLHECGRPFANRFELFEQIDQYSSVLREKGAQLPPGYVEVQQQAERVRRALAGQNLPCSPCHCDPLVENFLDSGHAMHLIDFEYSGNNDPMWDLGDLAVEGGFSEEQQEHLLEGYFAGEAPPLERARMVIYQAMCDLLWTLWGVVQHVNQNPAEDFWSYALGRQERCRHLMQSHNFAQQLELLEARPAPEPN